MCRRCNSRSCVCSTCSKIQRRRTPRSTLHFKAISRWSYKLLRIVNAASVGGRGISSIPHAVRLVGREMLHRWLAVILVASLGEKGDVSHELALTAITRARMCELVTTNAGGARQAASAFIVGLLSLLDVLLEVPMPNILARLEAFHRSAQCTAATRRATRRPTALGRVLRARQLGSGASPCRRRRERRRGCVAGDLHGCAEVWATLQIAA